jgi:LysM repeat protein
MVQNTRNLILTTIKLGVVVLLIGSLLWILNQPLPRLTPGGLQGEIFSHPTTTETPNLVTPSATPMLKATSTEAISKQRTEVITYAVQQYDTIFGIAEKFQLKPETILWGNYETFADDPLVLKPGMELNILPVDGVYYKWKEGDDLNAVASRFGVRSEDILVGNHLNPRNRVSVQTNIEPGAMLVIPGGRLEFNPWSAPRDPE